MENCGRFVFYNDIYYFTKNQKQNNRHCVRSYIISMVYTLPDHSSRNNQRMRICSIIVKYNIYNSKLNFHCECQCKHKGLVSNANKCYF